MASATTAAAAPITLCPSVVPFFVDVPKTPGEAPGCARGDARSATCFVACALGTLGRRTRSPRPGHDRLEPMASAELSRRAVKVVAYPPLSELRGRLAPRGTLGVLRGRGSGA